MCFSYAWIWPEICPLNVNNGVRWKTNANLNTKDNNAKRFQNSIQGFWRDNACCSVFHSFVLSDWVLIHALIIITKPLKDFDSAWIASYLENTGYLFYKCRANNFSISSKKREIGLLIIFKKYCSDFKYFN